jgi:hypothetical protein
MSTVLVYSTLACSQVYGPYTKGGGDLPRREVSVHIKGGAGVSNKHFLTPQGVVTTITQEELALCRQDLVFLQQEAAGYLVVDEKGKAVDPDHVATDMANDDPSRPLAPADVTGTLNDPDNVVTNVAPAPVLDEPAKTRRR